jgi:L-amino acid N-acyltransferase YncA
MMSDSIVSNSASTNSLAAETVPLVIRPSRDDDVNAMLDIYRRHIVRGVEPAFAYDPETLQPDDIKRRRRNMRKHRLPHLVAIAAVWWWAMPTRYCSANGRRIATR